MRERIDDGDAAAHARLEGHLEASLGGQRENLLAIGGHERLVGGDHVLASLQRTRDNRMCDARATDELDDQIDIGIVDDLVEIVREQMPHTVRLGLSFVERADANEFDVDAVVALEVILVLVVDVETTATHRASADQADFHSHDVPPLEFVMGIL